MDNNDYNNLIPDSIDEEFSLDSIIAEFKQETVSDTPSVSSEDWDDLSTPIVFDGQGESLGEVLIQSDPTPARNDTTPPPDENIPKDFYGENSLPEFDTDLTANRATKKKKPLLSLFIEESDRLRSRVLRKNVEISQNATHTEESECPEEDNIYPFQDEDTNPEDENVNLTLSGSEDDTTYETDELWDEEADDSVEGQDYAPTGEYEDAPEAQGEGVPIHAPSPGESFLSSVFGFTEGLAEKRRAKLEKLMSRPKTETPEMHPKKAAALYATQARSLWLRSILASGLCIVLVYLSFGLPAAGALGSSTQVRALICLILELSVAVIGLDIFTNGLTSLMNEEPGTETLISVSCIVSAIEAVYIAVSGNSAAGLPFCGVSALSMTCALWGGFLNCSSFSLSFSAASENDPTVVVSMSGEQGEGRVLSRSKRPVTGFVRQTEKSDIFEDAYRFFAPVLLSASIILSLFCFIAGEQCNNFIHTLSACTAVSASFSSILGFAFPYFLLSRRLCSSGAAIAGYSGCAELGRIRRIMLTDADLFPPRTVSIEDVAVTEVFDTKKVIAYASSMIVAADMGISALFKELMNVNGCSMQTVDNFNFHEGGGILGSINGEPVYVGSASFMRLMGIHPPKSSNSKVTVYVAIDNILAGKFTVNYSPAVSVHRSLAMLLRKGAAPVFAVRDFNITPMLIKNKFKISIKSCDFPSFSERYRVTSPENSENCLVTGMFMRGGLSAVAGLAARGRRLLTRLRFSAFLSILGTFTGMVFMLSLCWKGAYASASCGNLIIFMSLWLVPVFVLSVGLRK